MLLPSQTQTWQLRPFSTGRYTTTQVSIRKRSIIKPSPLRCPSSSNSSDGSADPNSYLRHPAIAQRDALRQFYVTYSPQEQLEVLETSRELLDASTTIHMLCHAADLSLKGQLLGDAETQDELVHQLYNVISDDLPSLPSQDLGAILWSMAAVQGTRQEESFGANPSWKDSVVDTIATQECVQDKVNKYNTKELINILYAVGVLCQPSPPQHVADYVMQLMGELAIRVDSTPYVRGSLTASDYADLASVCARVFLNYESLQDTSTASGPVVPSGAIDFMVFLAGEVRRSLANRHSARAAFLPRDLARFLAAFASFQLQNQPAVVAMFDVVAGFVVARIRSKHLNAVTRPEDIAAVLGAYAQQAHRSVSVPELLTAVGEQMRRNAAQVQEQLAATQLDETVSGGPPDLRCTLPTLLSVLESHRILGFAPDAVTLTALLPGLRRSLADSNPDEVVKLFELFEVFDFYPGSGMVSLMVSRVEEVATQGGGSEERMQGELLVERARLHAAAFLQGRAQGSL